MCELLALSADKPLEASLWLGPFSQRGGLLGPEKDGWGVAYFFGKATAVFRQPESAAFSPCLRHLRGQHIYSQLFLAHLRRASRSLSVNLANTHPFERELGGYSFVFAHHGNVLPVKEDPAFALRRFRPVGDTDSEHAFCYILDRLCDSLEEDPSALEPDRLAPRLKSLADSISERGQFNMLLATARSLYAYCDDHLWVCEGSEPCEAGQSATLTLVATYPFYDRCCWRRLEPHELLVCQGGSVTMRLGDAEALAPG